MAKVACHQGVGSRQIPLYFGHGIVTKTATSHRQTIGRKQHKYRKAKYNKLTWISYFKKQIRFGHFAVL